MREVQLGITLARDEDKKRIVRAGISPEVILVSDSLGFILLALFTSIAAFGTSNEI